MLSASPQMETFRSYLLHLSFLLVDYLIQQSLEAILCGTRGVSGREREWERERETEGEQVRKKRDKGKKKSLLGAVRCLLA